MERPFVETFPPRWLPTATPPSPKSRKPMSKLSPALKALIAKGADPLPGPSASRLHALFSKYDASVSSPKSWVTMAVSRSRPAI